MNHKLTLLAVFTSSLVGLTACSGGGGGGDSHSNAPAPGAQLNQPQVKPNTPKAEEPKKPEAEAPKAEEPKKPEAEAPKVEEPKKPEADTPKVEEPKKPEAEMPKAEEPKKPEAWDKEMTVEERKKVEDIVEPFHVQGTKYTWRQLTAFKSSPKTTAANPLAEGSQNNRAGAARNDNVAAYVQGEGRFGDYGKKALSKDKYLKETNYDIDFLKSAEIKPDEVQTYALKDKNDVKAGAFHFVNQKYSSYLMWKSEEAKRLDRETLYAYVTVPTNPTAFTKAQLQAKLNATYKGHLLVNKNAKTDEVHKADLELNADFNAMTLKGKITNRDDELLSGQASYAEYSKDAGDYTHFVTSKAEEDASSGYVYISEEKLNERKPQLRTLDINIPEVSIAQQNDTDVYFFQKRQKSGNGGLEYIDPTTHNKVQAGEISGILAGPNAEEVVGEIKMRNERASFGAREKSNP